MPAPDPKITRLALLAQCFRPAAPIDRLSLLRGRDTQAQDIISAVFSPGTHVALFGERGMGKTSLANVLAEILSGIESKWHVGRVTCNVESRFDSIWRDIFQTLSIPAPDVILPETIRSTLASLSAPVLIVVDELDRVEDNESLSLLADTIKGLSDHDVLSKLLLVGVASSVEGLVGEHQSIARSLSQVELPRLSAAGSLEILTGGYDRCSLEVDAVAANYIVGLSSGLPHYTHLLGLHAGEAAIQDDRERVSTADVESAIRRATDKHSLRSAFDVAIRSNRKGTLYTQVLTACALVTKSEYGYFAAGQVKEPLTGLLGRSVEIGTFAPHLKEFLTYERGSVLQRTGVKRRFLYRFSDPLLQPYVVLEAIRNGLISMDDALTP